MITGNSDEWKLPVSHSIRFLQAFFCFLFLGQWAIAQITFEPGYYINTTGNVINGFVANEKWGKNPDAFLFKANLDSVAVSYGLDNSREFGIGSSYKYERHKVRLEVSSDLSGDLNGDRNPKYEDKEVFLQVLLDGEIRLFAYRSSNNIRYFVGVNASEDLVPLVYKRYRTSGGNIGYNTQFRQQLAEMFNCDTNMPKADRIDYKESDLIHYLLAYAVCSGTSVSEYKADALGNQVIVSARFGLSTASLMLEQDNSFESPTVNQVTADFGSAFYPRIGLQFEVILPARGNRWSIFADPSFQKVTYQTKFIRKYPALDVEVQSNINYVTIEFPLGVRRYFHWNPDSGLFVNLSLSMRFNLASKIEFMADQALGRPDDIEVSATQGYFSTGVGIKVNRHIALEGRIHGGFNILGDNPMWNAQFGPGGSLILGFSI